MRIRLYLLMEIMPYSDSQKFLVSVNRMITLLNVFAYDRGAETAENPEQKREEGGKRKRGSCSVR